MKRGETIEVGWMGKVKSMPTDPAGYSTVDQIAEKIGFSRSGTLSRLKALKVHVIKGKTGAGQRANFYKD